MDEADRLLAPGAFIAGCNYVASHAGLAMWDDWQPEVVEADLRQLAGAGIRILRVLPLWPAFQPIELLRGGSGTPREVRIAGRVLGSSDEERAGLSPVAMDRFAAFAEMARTHGQSLIVGLITGWASGRLWVPPALEGRDVLTDPFALRWQVRLVRAFVHRFRTSPAIVGWDLGNECNCMSPVTSSDAAWAWTAAIADAIRVEDPSRPVISGMHGLSPAPEAAWRIQDQAELTDVLTTHPYPVFTPLCDQDPVDSLRGCLHAAAESRLYADIGGRPCFAEEIGTLGPMIADEAAAARHLRASLFSLWAHDCRALLWWCAYDLGGLAYPPYDWDAWERELGLFRVDRGAKPAAAEIGRFNDLVAGLPFPSLPSRVSDAVCILTHGQDPWAAAYASFVLAVQAGFSLRFQYADQPLADAALYLVPSARGGSSLSRASWLELRERANAGATLYLSLDDGILSPFEEVFGVRVRTRERRTGPASFSLDGVAEVSGLSTAARLRLGLEATRAEVLAREPDGNPILTRAALGKGEALLPLPADRGQPEQDAGGLRRSGRGSVLARLRPGRRLGCWTGWWRAGTCRRSASRSTRWTSGDASWS